jgi:murein DD-endopeptidase MepM/ murein hydrolase activator NlpD
MDFAMPVGTEIYAMSDGVITDARDHSPDPSGLMIVIDHGNGWMSRYLHLSEFAVKRGDQVRKGQQIGNSGTSGTKTSAPHLHLDIRASENAVAGFVAKFGRPQGTFPGDFVHGGYGVPAEPLVPVDSYDPSVVTGSKNFGVSLWKDLKQVATKRRAIGAGGALLLIGGVGTIIYAARRYG